MEFFGEISKGKGGDVCMVSCDPITNVDVLDARKDQGNLVDIGFNGTCVWLLVFESPVWSSLLMLRGLNRNHNWSCPFPEAKKTRPDCKKPRSAVFRPVSVCISFN